MSEEVAKEEPQATKSAGQAPIVQGIHRLKEGEQTAARGIVDVGNQARSFTDKLLRTEAGPAEETTIFKTPFFAAGHILDATAMNALRRTRELVEPAISGLRAAYRATIGAVLSPISTLIHHIEYLKNPIRALTSATKMAINAIRIPTRAADELIDRGINKPVNQVNFQVEKIPLLGQLISKPTNFITGICAKISNKVREAMDWVTSPVDYIHDAVAPA